MIRQHTDVAIQALCVDCSASKRNRMSTSAPLWPCVRSQLLVFVQCAVEMQKSRDCQQHLARHDMSGLPHATASTHASRQHGSDGDTLHQTKALHTIYDTINGSAHQHERLCTCLPRQRPLRPARELLVSHSCAASCSLPVTSSSLWWTWHLLCLPSSFQQLLLNLLCRLLLFL